MKNFSVRHTNNLDVFKFHNVNRDIKKTQSQSRIKRISESMVQDGLMKVPIIVTTKFYVVDGQHRLEAAKIAGKGIWFIVDETIPNSSKGIFDAARKFNRDMKEWSKEDYIHGFTEQGNQSYQILQDFGKKYPMFSLTERIMLLMGSGTRNVEKKEFSAGKFLVKDEKIGEELAEKILKLKPHFERGYNKSVFVRTLLTIIEKKPSFVFDEFLHKVQLRPASIYVCGDKKSCAVMIEDIYNYKRRNDEKLNLRF
jgi:hypothetical protein